MNMPVSVYPANHTNTSTNDVYARLRDMIVTGTLPPGSKIKQEHVAEQLNTSRTPVINALHKLATGGLVDYFPNQGFYVHRVSVKELLELFSFRLALDAIIIEDLVYALTDEQIEGLAKLFERFVGVSTPDPVEYRLVDMQFHTSLIELCDNDLAKRVNDTFNILNRSYLVGLVRPPKDTLDEHLAVIRALRHRDCAAARSAIATHVEKTRQMLSATVHNLRKMGVNPDTIYLDDLERLNQTL